MILANFVFGSELFALGHAKVDEFDHLGIVHDNGLNVIIGEERKFAHFFAFGIFLAVRHRCSLHNKNVICVQISMRKIGHQLSNGIQDETSLDKEVCQYRFHKETFGNGSTCKCESLHLFTHHRRTFIENGLHKFFDVRMDLSIFEGMQSLEHGGFVH